MSGEASLPAPRPPGGLGSVQAHPGAAPPSRVLIIDDTPAIHDDLRKILARVPNRDLEQDEAMLFGVAAAPAHRADFEIDSAYQGEEGLALVRKAIAAGRGYALAFVDVRMPPGWDGIETAAQLWTSDPDLQIVICTAYSDYSWDLIVERLGSRDNLLILKKPFDAIEVIQLAHALARKWLLTRQAQSRFLDLESQVEARTQDLRAANEALLRDIAQRERAEARLKEFSGLSQRLSIAKTAREAGEVMVNVADHLLGWDACSFSLYSTTEDRLQDQLTIDTIDGQRHPTVPPDDGLPPSALARRTIRDGAQLILKENPNQPVPGGIPFGATDRFSASILSVPVRHAARVVGLLSIHSYQVNAYDHHSLETLQSLADYCAGALDRIRTEEALYHAQERLSHLLRQSPAVIYSFLNYAESNTPGWVSENVVQLTGYSASECNVDGWWPAHVHPGDWARVAAERIQRLREATATFEYRLRHKDGTYRWVRDERRRVGDSGGTTAEVVGTWVDVTAHKELEQQLRQAQKMEAVGQLAGGVAHDFNNILAVILGNTEMVLTETPPLSEATVASLKEVAEAAQRAANLTRQLLAFSRKQVLQTQPLNLNDLIGNLVKMLDRIIGEDIELQCNYAGSLPLIQADVGMIEQVLVNFVVNARDAMPRGGELRIRTEKQTLGGPSPEHPEARPGSFVALSVADTGTGIAPDHLAHLFEPFFTTKEVGKGTGLGLATVHGIIQQHQGWIEVASQLGAGTTFRVYFPAVLGSGAMPSIEPVPACPRGGNETILLVEDDKSVRLLTRRVLEKFGYRVREAASGHEALNVWQEAGPDIKLLLTDIIMPDGLTGIGLAEQLRARAPALKVIFMSGYSADLNVDPDRPNRQLKHRLLQKPFQPLQLVQAVRSCLDE